MADNTQEPQVKNDAAAELDETKLEQVTGAGRGQPVGGIVDGTSNIVDGTSNTLKRT